MKEEFSEDTFEKRQALLERSKRLRVEGKFSNIVYDRVIVFNRRPRLENGKEGDSNV